jgi:hypothetical protein
VTHQEQVEYLYFAQDGGPKYVKVPVKREEAHRVLRSFRAYVAATKEKIQKAVYQRVLSGTRADSMTASILTDANLREGPVPVAKSPRRGRAR